MDMYIDNITSIFHYFVTPSKNEFQSMSDTIGLFEGSTQGPVENMQEGAQEPSCAEDNPL